MTRTRSFHFKQYLLSQLLLAGIPFKLPAVHIHSLFCLQNPWKPLRISAFICFVQLQTSCSSNMNSLFCLQNPWKPLRIHLLFCPTSQVPALVDKMIAGGTTNRRVSSGATDNLTALMKRPWEATVGLTSFQRPVSLQTKGF